MNEATIAAKINNYAQQFAGNGTPTADDADHSRIGRVGPDKLLQKAVEAAKSIGGNDAGLDLARDLRDTGCSEFQALAIMRSYAARLPYRMEPYTDTEITATVRQVFGNVAPEPSERRGRDSVSATSACQAPAPNPEGLSPRGDGGGDGTPDLLTPLLNDHGNAERLIALHGDDLRYCHAFKKWLVYDERRWEVDTTGRAAKLAKDAMLKTYQAAVGARNEPVEKFARLSLSARSIANMLSMAEPEIFITVDQLDTHVGLLNFLNGTVDLQTAQLRPHQRGDFITKLVHYDYNPDARCPRFLEFLAWAMGAQPDSGEPGLERTDRLVNFLQKAFGYSLTGDTSEKAVFLCHGGGDNGKTTLLSTFRQLIAEYAVLIQIDTLMVKQESNNSSADLADLHGARFAMTSETEEGQRIAEGRLKRITQGMGRIRACRKYENPFDWDETHKLWMDANHKPVIRGTDNAIWNRLRYLPFDAKVDRDRMDKKLPQKLLGEAEGILAWAVAGASLWYREGLGKPAEVMQATEQYRSEMDQIGRFIDDCCITGEYASAKGREFYTAYRKWAEESGEHFVTETAFGLKLKEHGFVKKHTNSGNSYDGIGLRV